MAITTATGISIFSWQIESQRGARAMAAPADAPIRSFLFAHHSEVEIETMLIKLWLACSLFLLMATPWRAPQNKPSIKFSDITQSSKINFVHRAGTKEKRYILEAASGGVALFDYDNDGWLDVYLVNGSTFGVLLGTEKAVAGCALYRNNHDGTFTDVTGKAGVGNTGAWGMGVTIGDYDNDGWE